MGKLIIEFVIPALIVLPFVWWAVRKWYLWCFPSSIKRQKELNKATAKYEKSLGIGAATETPRTTVEADYFSQPTPKKARRNPSTRRK